MAEMPGKSELEVISSGGEGARSAPLRRGICQIFGMFIKRGINPSLAEELTQKSVFDAVRGKGSFDPAKGTVETWLMGIARNSAFAPTPTRRTTLLLRSASGLRASDSAERNTCSSKATGSSRCERTSGAGGEVCR